MRNGNSLKIPFSEIPVNQIQIKQEIGLYLFWGYILAHFLGNFREETKKVPTRTVSKKFPKVSRKFPIKFRALLPLAHFRKGNFSRIDLHKHCEETFRHL